MGGVADSIPYERAFQQGCDRVVVVLSKTRSYVRRPEKLQPVIERTYREYPNFCRAMARRAEQYNTCRERLFQLEREGRVLVLAPVSTHKGIPHRAGYQKAENAVGRWVSAGGGPDGRDPGFPHAGQSVTSSSAAGQLGWRASRARASPSTVKKAAMRPRSSTSASQARRTASRTAAARRM